MLIQKFAVFSKRRWQRRRPTLRRENRFFGKAFPLSLNLALFIYASREDIFTFIKLTKLKLDFSK